jgi:hypothetical protein
LCLSNPTCIIIVQYKTIIIAVAVCEGNCYVHDEMSGQLK